VNGEQIHKLSVRWPSKAVDDRHVERSTALEGHRVLHKARAINIFLTQRVWGDTPHESPKDSPSFRMRSRLLSVTSRRSWGVSPQTPRGKPEGNPPGVNQREL
jgi:hypothetical protein